jgi:hypothetical protein
MAEELTRSLSASSEPSAMHPAKKITSQSDRLETNIEGINEANELDDGLWEDESESEEDAMLGEAREAAAGTFMDLEDNDGVDVHVPQLLDYLSTTPSSPPLVDLDVRPAVTKKRPASEPKEFLVANIEF